MLERGVSRAIMGRNGNFRAFDRLNTDHTGKSKANVDPLPIVSLDVVNAIAYAAIDVTLPALHLPLDV